MTMNIRTKAMGTLLRRFREDARGSVAIMYGLALVPLVGLAGAAVDYSMASSTRARMAQASDAAALAAAKATNLTRDQRDTLARKVFDANMGDAGILNVTFKVSDVGTGVRVDVSADIKSQFMQIIGVEKTGMQVFSEVARGDGQVEVALVLDVTGSMKNDMDGLKTASKNFINAIFTSASASDSLKVSLVPYVASVNPGKTNLGMSYMDSSADSRWHASTMEWRWTGYINGCDPQWPSGGGGGGGGDGPGSGGDGAWIQDKLNKLAWVGMELFGIKSAAALGETPNTKEPLSGSWFSPGKPYVTNGAKAFVPTGFQSASNCWLSNPGKINFFDLIDRIPGASWGGCVEARPEPYDVTDDPPTGDANTRFVPYFWADEHGAKNESTWAANNYMDDTPVPSGWTLSPDWATNDNIFKYNGKNTPSKMDETLGPNKSCPTELLRLSSDKTSLLNKIESLKAIPGGGTINSEGVAWGWRTITPKKPFADGKDYGKAKKFLVLMSDGENELGENNKWGPVMSHYTAYGYLRSGRFSKENFQVAQKYLDDRFSLVCENVKKAGITVMTVYFRDNNSSAKNLMKNCASSGMYFFQAADAKGLDAAFQQIAAEIGRLRITK